MRRPFTVVGVVLTALLLGPLPVHGAQIEEVTGFGTNPGDLAMYRYVPDGLPAGRPLVVALHGCTQDAPGYGTSSGWVGLADRLGFALLLPQQRSANNLNGCFNWFEPGDTTRDRGETASIIQMVQRMRSDTGSAAGRTYVSGLSAGGAMTASLLATNADTFAAGGVVAGIPYRCAESVATAFGCMSPGTDLRPDQWGDKVRAAGSGPWPDVSIWHGTADTTVAEANATEVVEQWTDVHGIGAEPSTTDTVEGFPHEVYAGPDGTPVVQRYRLTGMGHGQPVDPGSGCGQSAPYMLDVGLCAAGRLSDEWGLGPGR